MQVIEFAGTRKLKEYSKLLKLLKEADVPYIAASDDCGFYRIKYPQDDKVKLSVVIGPGTYGAAQGLLETWTMKKKDEPIGWQTAEQVFQSIIDMEKQR